MQQRNKRTRGTKGGKRVKQKMQLRRMKSFLLTLAQECTDTTISKTSVESKPYSNGDNTSTPNYNLSQLPSKDTSSVQTSHLNTNVQSTTYSNGDNAPTPSSNLSDQSPSLESTSLKQTTGTLSNSTSTESSNRKPFRGTRAGKIAKEYHQARRLSIFLCCLLNESHFVYNE